MRIARSTGTVSGLLIVLLGLWGALIAFVGPYFDYSFGVNSTWHYTSDRLWLDILPGVLAVLGGLILLGAGRRPAGVLGGWLAVVAGTWFVVGPAVSLTWETGQGPIGRPLFGTTRQTLELLGYFYGLGALILALGAFAIGRFVSRPTLATEAEYASAAAAAPAARPADTAPPARRPGAREPVAREPETAGEPAARGEGAPRTRLPFGRRRREAHRERAGSAV